MPQRTVTLIRHGQCFSEGTDPPLTQSGRKQAAMTADLFKAHDIESIYYSPLQRARETAEIIAHQLPGAAFIGCDSLRECIPTIPSQFSQIFQDQARENPDYRPVNVRNAQLRLDEVCSEIFTPAVDRDVHDLVICHGNVLRYLICWGLNIDPHAWVQLHPPANCSLSQIIIAPNAIHEAHDAGVILTTLFTFNETWHLPQELHTLS
jgi:serine/threonine-protein phosphatase PGAM5